MANNSDYNKIHTNLLKFLPEVYNSEVNKSIFENLFNRFFTKDETKRVAGYIGQGNPKAKTSRRIPEATPHRQAFQLQPLLYSKIGSVEHITSWKDLQAEITRLGIDMGNFDNWGKTLQFNWCPPIDINKIVNYSDYYWYDPTGASPPQYITVRNNCATATAKYNFINTLIDQFGSTFKIVDVDVPNNLVKIKFNYTDLFANNLEINIVSTNNPLDNSTIIDHSVYDADANLTIVYLKSGFINPVVNDNFTLNIKLAAALQGKTCACDGTAGWDSLPFDSNGWDGSCGYTPAVKGINQWISQNKWLHKSDVPNFSGAQVAVMPIIEFEANLELNEWNYTKHIWKYRKEQYGDFTSTESKPSIIELIPATIFTPYLSTGKIVLSNQYGDLTGFFKPNTTFTGIKTGNVFGGVYTITHSTYEILTPGDIPNTVLHLTTSELTDFINDNIVEIHPYQTSLGDPWAGYLNQWLYVEQKPTTAINHQTPNELLNIITPMSLDLSGNYEYQYGIYTEQYRILTDLIVDTLLLSNTSAVVGGIPLNRKAMVGFNDIRVYVNDIRSYGTYDEISQTIGGINYIVGIQFHAVLPKHTVVRIEVGEAAINDYGNNILPVRMIESDAVFDVTLPANQYTYVSLIEYRKSEQVKTITNQYPIFDIYDIFSNSVYTANTIFGFKEDPTANIFGPVGKRISRNATTRDYTFEQFLITDNNELLAYRNYQNTVNAQYWYNPHTKVFKSWNGLNWDDKILQGTHITNIHVSNITPNPILTFNGMLWWNNVSNELKIATVAGSIITWNLSNETVLILSYDEMLQTVWRHGTNNEEYIPRYVDSNRHADGDLVTDNTTGITAPVNLPIGSVNGDWEIPDPLYYNHLHENRKEISLRNIYAHFQSIIDNQPVIPALTGRPSDGFRMLDTWEVNFGLGGKIKEYNNGFDSFLSSLYIDTVDVRELISFAREQYQNTTLIFQDYFINKILELLNNFEVDHIVHPENYISEFIITQYENNAYLDSIYGDSTTYTRSTNTGVQNVIATLPYLGIVDKVKPVLLWDPAINLSQIIHHDGHYANYILEPAVRDSIVKNLLQFDDVRTNAKIGVSGIGVPPMDINAYNPLYNNSIRTGVYWYDINTKNLYRLNVVSVADAPPPISLPQGSIWFDTTIGLETLKILQGTTWVIPPTFSLGDQKLYDGSTPESSTISAWQILDLNYLFVSTIFEVENRLYDNVPNFVELTVDLDSYNSNSKVKSYLRESFYGYSYLNNISAPFSSNEHYIATDAWTWNYKYSNITLYPRTLSTTVSGGDWKDLYEKLYNTPYPHLEPWKIQGYTVQPDWWESIYGNDNISVYGNRKWKSNYDIVTQSFVPIIGNEDMWYNIINGIVPVGKLLPNNVTIGTGLAGQINGCVYVSVNVTNRKIAVGSAVYSPDSLIPPFADYNTVKYQLNPNGSNNPTSANWMLAPTIIDPPYRTVFWNYGAHIVSPGADYKFDDFGPVEWFWNNSIFYNYSKLDAIFRIDPVNILTNIFGINFSTIDMLKIDSRTKQTFAHNRTIFHGDVLDTVQYVNNGINQWYTNFNRYSGFDTGYSDFNSKWINWVAPLSYQFNTFLNPNTLFLQHSSLDLTQYDWNLTTKKSPGVYNYWLDAFNIKILNIPPVISLYFNESEWKFELTNFAPTSRNIQYYGVQEYPFSIDKNTNICSIYSYNITGVDVLLNKFTIAGDQTELLPNGAIFTVDLSTGNNGNWIVDHVIYDPTLNSTIIYTVNDIIDPTIDGRVRLNMRAYNIADVSMIDNAFILSGNVVESYRPGYAFTIANSTVHNGTWTVANVAYDQILNITTIIVNEDISSSIVDGYTSIETRRLPWKTGDQLHISTTKFLPVEIRDDLTYFIIKINNTDFKLADTKSEAIANIPIEFSSSGEGTHTIGKLNTNFLALNGRHTNRIWRVYEIDKSYVRSFTPPYNMSGMQNLINLVIGYGAFLFDAGFHINENKNIIDPVYGEIVSWEFELQRFIDWAFSIRTANYQVRDRYEVTVDYDTDHLVFVDPVNSPASLNTGDPITLYSNSNVPYPLSRGISYYVIRDTVSTIKLALTYQNALNNTAIDLIITSGVDRLYISEPKNIITKYPTFEINPFRVGLSFRPPQGGIVSDIVKGPFDILTHSIFDQYKRPLPADSIKILRHDKVTHIEIQDGIPNDYIPLNSIAQDPYQWLHISGANLFVDTYEHIVWFGNYTQSHDLIYDPFIGQNTNKFELDFERQTISTGRPNVGGHYWSNGVLQRNIEMNVVDMKNYYSTYDVQERTDIMKHSRALLGYEGTKNYLDQINVKPKSQFIFWRGMIQHKGSVNAVKAFINSKHFIDANIDEFWAYKIADFGSAYEQNYPELYLTPTDTILNEVTFNIQGGVTECNPGYDVTPYDQDCGYSFMDTTLVESNNNTITINSTDSTRWYEHPLNTSEFYFDMKPTHSIEIGVPISNITDNTPPNALPGNSILPVSVLGDNTTKLSDTVERDVIIIDGNWTHMFMSNAPFTNVSQHYTVHHSIYNSITNKTWIFINEELFPGTTGNITMENIPVISIETDVLWGVTTGPFNSLFPGNLTISNIIPRPTTIIPNSSALTYNVGNINSNGTQLNIIPTGLPIIELTGNITISPSSIRTSHFATGTAGKAHFKIDGNFVDLFTTGFGFTVSTGSKAGPYTVSTSAYDVNTDRTLVYVTTAILATGTINGFTIVDYNTGSDDNNGHDGYIAFKITGNHTSTFVGGLTVTVAGDISEINGSYKVLAAGAFYDPVAGQTIIYVTDTLLSGLGDKYYISDISTPAVPVQKIIAVLDDQLDTDKIAVFGNRSTVYNTGLLINYTGNLNGISYNNQYKILSNLYNADEQLTYITIVKNDPLQPTFVGFLDTLHMLNILTPRPIVDVKYSKVHLNGEYFIHNTGVGYQFSQQIDSLTTTNNGSWDYDASPILKHGFKSDTVRVLVKMQLEYTVDTYTHGGPAGPVTIPVNNYIFNSKGIIVYRNGIIQILGIDYTEELVTGLICNQITINVNPGDVVKVEHTWSKLEENEHYTTINSDIIKINMPDIINAYSVTIWGYNTDYNSQNPAKVLDKKSNVTLKTIQLWDPARDHHYYLANHIVDLHSNNDPAKYTVTNLDNEIDSVSTFKTGDNAWGREHNGVTWWDTSNLYYVPYYDNKVFNSTLRLKYWGRLADWSNIKVYQWIGTNIPPESWDIAVSTQTNNPLVSSTDRISGTIRKTLTRKINNVWTPVNDIIEHFNTLINGVTTGTNTVFTLSNIKLVSISVNSQSSNELITTGFNIDTLTANMKVQANIIDSTSTMELTVNNIAYDTTSNTTTITVLEDITDVAVSTIKYYPLMSVYLNGFKTHENIQANVNGTFNIDNLRECDNITTIQFKLSNNDIIQQGITAGIYNNIIEHTAITKIVNNIPTTTYYYWVGGVASKGSKLMSCLEAQNQLTVNPAPYMFMSGYLPATDTLPLRQDMVTIRGLNGLVDENRRYVIQFTRDFTLRDLLEYGKTPLDLKDTFTEWKLIREKQFSHIPAELWFRMVEAIVGYTINNSNVKVPAYEYEIYDAINNTDVRYGLGRGQAFVNGAQALKAIMNDLTNPNINFAPFDISVFLQQYNNLETKSDQIAALTKLYYSFTSEHVNRIFFTVLHTAFANKMRWKELFKTSFVSLHGIRILETTGKFDD